MIPKKPSGKISRAELREIVAGTRPFSMRGQVTLRFSSPAGDSLTKPLPESCVAYIGTHPDGSEHGYVPIVECLETNSFVFYDHGRWN